MMISWASLTSLEVVILQDTIAMAFHSLTYDALRLLYPRLLQRQGPVVFL